MKVHAFFDGQPSTVCTWYCKGSTKFSS